MKSPRPIPAPSMKIAIVCMMVVAGLCVALGVGHIARKQELIRLGYDLSEARTELRQLQEEQRQLRLERSVLTNPERIRRLAESLGMAQPVEGQVRVVRPEAAELAGLGPGGWPRE